MGIIDNLKDGASSIGQGLLGTVEKAIIRIADERPKEGENVNPRDCPAAGGGSGGGGYGFDPGMDVSANLDAANQLASMPGPVGEAGAMLSQDLQGTANYDKEFKVQFNPSSLHISGYVENESLNMDFSKKNKSDELKATGMELQLHMNVQLIFDQVSPRLAFNEDMTNISPSSIIKSAAAEIAGLIYSKNRRNNSVQTEVEGFLAATQSSRTKKIQFAWGEMAYSGILRNVNAKYTMFDMLGRPVRATVNLSIFLIDPNISRTDMGYWGKAYKKLFEAGVMGGSDGIGSRVMGALNIE